jgi:hypothetical protein
MMSVSIIAAAAPQAATSTQGLVSYLQSLFGPLFLGIVGIVALFFFLFTREITPFVQLAALAVVIRRPPFSTRRHRKGAGRRHGKPALNVRGPAPHHGLTACTTHRPPIDLRATCESPDR